MHRRISITLPDETIELIDQVIEKGDSPEERLGDRSRFINEAVQYCIAQKALVNLRKLLQQAEEAFTHFLELLQAMPRAVNYATFLTFAKVVRYPKG